MKRILGSSITALVLANLVALVLLLGNADGLAARGGDYCTGTTGACDCYSGPWSPDGCYDSASADWNCVFGYNCE